jgi:mono/diheme cytochrome c family protein
MTNRMNPMMLRTALIAAGLTAALASPALAQRAAGPAPEVSGKEIYEGICQGCHMPDAKGAQGAGLYPALAGNRKLAAKSYPALVVARGQKAMPEFGTSMSDQQIANVVNYIRTNFGNSYTDAVAPADVKLVRPSLAETGAVRPPG